MKKTTGIFRRPFVHSGFTLVELAIVLVIVGLLLAMLIPTLGAQRDIRLRNETQALLQEAREALIGYALVNRYLPCPDSDAVPDGIENARNAAGDCIVKEGTLPWNTLGIARADAWGRHFGYRPDDTFSNNLTMFTITDAETASGIEINDEYGNPIVSTNSRPAAVVISYGTNGYGGLNLIQASPANIMPAPTGTDETENTDGNVTFASHAPMPAGSINEFDDLLIWVSPKVLVNRMVVAGRLP